MRTQHPPIRMKSQLPPCTTFQQRHRDLQLYLFYQTRSVSLGAITLGDESGFKMYRKTGITGRYVLIATTAANVTSGNDKTVIDGTLYYYRVCATNGAGDSASSNEASGTTPLKKPIHVTATAVSSSQINLTWIDNSASETGYKIEREITPGTYAQIAEVGANVQIYSEGGLAPNTRYCYRVRATNGTMDSDYSDTACAVTFP